MLIYHPAFDAYHCTFRMLAVMSQCPKVEVDKARIIDFYLAFPSAILQMRLPTGHTALRSEVKKSLNPYRNPGNPKRTFADMQHVQLAALGSLAASGFVDSDSLKDGNVIRSNKVLPPDVAPSVESFFRSDGALGSKIVAALCEVPTFGVGGLKERSDLLEFRYDNA
jgi:hypothetical protein